MAGRVNKKFVITLSLSLVGAFLLLAGAGFFLLKNSAGDLAKAGDQFMANKQFDNAVDRYSKAVNKEPTNTIYIQKWREALKSTAPELLVTYRNYFDQWMMATRALARLQTENVEIQREYLDLVEGTISPIGFSRADQDRMVADVDVLVENNRVKSPTGPWEVIKRYRGIAKLQIFNSVPESRPELAKEAEEDFLAALRADPTDALSAIGLQNLYNVQANRAATKSLADEAQVYTDKAVQVIDDFAAKNPNDPMILLALASRELDKVYQEVMTNKTADSKAGEIARKFQTELDPFMTRAFEAIKATDPDKVTMRILDQLRRLDSLLDVTGKQAKTEEILTKLLEARPNDSLLLATKAELYATRDDYKTAIATIQKIIELPTPPTSLEGMRLFGLRSNAQYLQAMWSGKLAALTPEAERAPVLAEAKALRTKFAAAEAPDSANLMFVDAQLAYVEGDYGRANRLLDQYDRATRPRQNVDALYLHAQVADRLNQPGLAKERLDSLLRIQASRLSALAFLADVEFRLQNYQRSFELYQNLRNVFPDSAFFKERAELLTALLGGANTSDPVTAALVEVQSMSTARPGQKDRSSEIVPFLERKVEELKYDPRIVQILANNYLRENRRADAVKLVNKAIAASPENEAFKRMAIAVGESDPLKASEALIDSDTQAQPIDKLVGKYQIYRQAGKMDDAEKFLIEAAKINPDDKRVVEYQFLDACEAQNWDLAKALTDRATKANMDEADGLTFKARLLANQGKHTEAVSAMEEAVAKGGAVPEVWRMKGRIEFGAGRRAAAVASFREALKLRPTDVGTVNDLMNALRTLDRADEALGMARASEKFARSDETFMNNWLNLEAAVGNRVFAIERREALARSSPMNRANLISLAQLYTLEREWTKARPVIEQARALSPGLDILVLDATWHWDQGEREKARAIYTKFIEDELKLGPTPVPHLAYATFLAQRQDMDGALVALESARKYQDPKAAEADKGIVDVYMGMGNYEQAALVCRRIINDGADSTDQMYRKRLVECLAKISNFTEAQKEIEAILKAEAETKNEDSTSWLLSADIKRGLGDERGQKETLDRAVAKFPDDPMVFLKRGEALYSDPKSARDAISDFNKALQLRPDMWMAYRMRALAHTTLNQKDEYIRDFRAAVKLAPYNDELLYGLISDLLRDGDRINEALDISSEALAKRPRDVEAMATIGSLFASGGKYPEAARFFKMAFELDKSDPVAQRYLDSLLNSTPPNTAEAQQVLVAIGEQRIKSNPGFLMAVAKLSMRLNQVRNANAASADALRLLDVNEPTQMLAWFNDLRRLLPKKEDLLRYLDEIAKNASFAKSQEWLNYFKITVNIEDPATRKETVAPAKELLSKAEDGSVQQLLYRSISSSMLIDGQTNDAAKVMRDGLGQFPDDVEMLNNLAYVLATELDRPDEAIPLAERAAALTPAVADIQDTLGTVYMKAKRCKEAVASFRRAFLLSSNPQQTISFTIHYADSLVCDNRTADARTLVAEAKKTFAANESSLSEDLKKKFTEMLARVEAAK